MTSSITAPLERQFGQMPGLNQMTSTSSAGASAITLQFELKLPIDIAEQQVQAAINAAGNLLPADLPHRRSTPRSIRRMPRSSPWPVTSKTDPLTRVHDMVDTAARPEDLAAARRRPGQPGGRPEAGYRVRANPTALAAYGLNVDDLRTTITNANVNTPKGNFDGRPAPTRSTPTTRSPIRRCSTT
jgi:multidrug efflux pump